MGCRWYWLAATCAPAGYKCLWRGILWSNHNQNLFDGCSRRQAGCSLGQARAGILAEDGAVPLVECDGGAVAGRRDAEHCREHGSRRASEAVISANFTDAGNSASMFTENALMSIIRILGVIL